MIHDRRPSDWRRVPIAAAATAMTPPVTSRQREVLRWRALGLTNKGVANVLDVSEFTVRNLLATAYRTLDAACLVDACRAMGWLTVPAA